MCAAAPLLAVDAPSMLYRAFFALPRTITGKDGRPVNALLGAANLILREVEAHDPRVVALCFGPDAAAYRVALYPGYHAAREEMPTELAAQWELAPGFFGAFGWEIVDHDTLEADDLLGTLARLEAEAGGTALILTGDRDMFQCAGERVTVLYVSTRGSRGAESVDPAGVEQRYGIPPRLVPDFIALRGDPSDGLPGARGVGEKTAAELLSRHGSLEGVLEAALGEQRPKLRQALVGSADQLRDFKRIATLQDAGVDPPPDRPTDYAAAAQAAAELGMDRLAQRLRVSG
jgi:5'-3' exonuclease